MRVKSRLLNFQSRSFLNDCPVNVNFPPGNVVQAVRHARQIQREIRIAQSMDSAELYGYAKQLGVPLDLLQKTAKLGRLPVVNFAAGGLGKQ